MADENQAQADGPETNETPGVDAQATDKGAVHSNDTKGNDDFAERVANASTPEELARLTKEFFERGETPAQDTKDDGEAVSQPDDQAPGEEAEGSKTEESDKADAGKVEEEAKGKDDDEDDDDEGKSGSPKRIRIRPKEGDTVGVRALEIQRRNRDLTLDECLERARAELGLQKSKDSADAPAKEKADDGQPKTVEDADKRLAELRALRRKAMTEELDFAKAADIDDQIDALKDRRSAIVADAAKAQDAEAGEYDKQFDASQAKALELYEFVRTTDGPEAKRMLEIDAQLKASGDPLYSDPNKPLILAQMVAREFRVAPKAPSSAKPVAAKPAVTAKPKHVAPIASGNSRTASTASTNSAGQQLLDQADRIKSPDEMAEFLATLRT